MQPIPDINDIPQLILTGERTLPDIPIENYWFRRHEVVYEQLIGYCHDAIVLDAGCGEGYGANMIGAHARRVIGLDYDRQTITHVHQRYPHIDSLQANLTALPLRDQSVDVVVTCQVIEHLWDQEQFMSECFRILHPGGRLLITTPNRLTFSPGRDQPVNPFHTRELNPTELVTLLEEHQFYIESLSGLFHGSRLKEFDKRYGGSFIDTQVHYSLTHLPWPDELLADVQSITTQDFLIVPQETHPCYRIDNSLDLIGIAVRL